MNQTTIAAMRAQFQGDDTLMHYGVIGMKWGVRRYQPYGQGYDAEHQGRFIGKKEFKADNKRLRQAVKDASALGYAMSKSAYRANKADQKRLNKPSSRNEKNASIERGTANELERRYKEAEKKAQDTVKEMRDKYGKEAVRDLVYSTDKMGNRVIDEKVAGGKEVAASVMATIGASVLSVAIDALAGIPGPSVGVLVTPATRTSIGNRVYRDARTVNAKAEKKRGRAGDQYE